MDQSIPDLFSLRVRGLQGIYSEAHQALINWGCWSRDRAGIFPADARPSVWDQFKADENEAWGDVPEESKGPAEKAERAEEDPYNELQGLILDERINSPLLCRDVSRALVVAYVWTIPEYQMPARAGCLPDHFCERLEAGLRFAARFA